MVSQGLEPPDPTDQDPAKHIFFIEEAILTLRCPHVGCRAPFYDFTGCTALACSTCDCDFCAWCLCEFADDHESHSHVLRCELNPGKDYFSEFAVFEAEQRKRKRRLIDDYVSRLRMESSGLGDLVERHFVDHFALKE